MRRWTVSVLTLFISACAIRPDVAESIARTPPMEFRTEGCSMVPDYNFRACCAAHDRSYWCGGTRWQRLQADRKLARCINGHGHPGLAALYYRGVRIAGGPWWPTAYRWGFGWDYATGYSDLPWACPLEPNRDGGESRE